MVDKKGIIEKRGLRWRRRTRVVIFVLALKR
jgi:hypothetical protein